MANSPPSVHVVKYKGTGNSQVFALLPSQVLGTQDGSDVGTGGPGLATLETPNVGSLVLNRSIEFLDDRYVLVADGAGATSGVYKKAQGGAGQWGRAYPGNCQL